MQKIWRRKVWLVVIAVVCVWLAAGCEAKGQKAEVEDLTELYSLALPAGDWQQQGQNIWAPVQENEVLTDVRVWLVRLEDCAEEAAKKQLQEAGYAEQAEPPGFWQRSEDGLQYSARLVMTEQDCWLVCCCWPEAEAKWAEPLAAALASFELV